MPREILIANLHPRLRLDRRAVARVFQILDEHAHAFRPSRLAPRPLAAGELSIVFLTDAALAQLHADFLNDASPTDVITFCGDVAQGTAGEICVSVDAAVRQVLPFSRRASPLALSAELALYLVHGWLHLVGYDDLQVSKKRQMRRAETRAMQLLTTTNALPVFSVQPILKHDLP